MSLYRRFPSENQPSFITTNTYQRSPIFSSPSACELFVKTIYDVRREAAFKLLAFAVMPDHVHIILVPPTGELGRIVQLIKGRFARVFNRQRGSTGHVWQSRYHERTLVGDTALARAMDYVEHNPAAAGLADTREGYPWCSANRRFETDVTDFFGQAKA